jgi:hypothetical protein
LGARVVDAKVPASLANAPQLETAGVCAAGALFRMWLWLASIDNSTDAVVPTSTAQRLAEDPELLSRLVDSGLLAPVERGEVQVSRARSGGDDRGPVEVVARYDGYYVCDFLTVNRTHEAWSAHIEEQKRKSALAAASRREAADQKRQQRGDPSGEIAGQKEAAAAPKNLPPRGGSRSASASDQHGSDQRGDTTGRIPSGHPSGHPSDETGDSAREVSHGDVPDPPPNPGFRAGGATWDPADEEEIERLAGRARQWETERPK